MRSKLSLPAVLVAVFAVAVALAVRGPGPGGQAGTPTSNDPAAAVSDPAPSSARSAWLDTLDRFQADPGVFFAAGGFGGDGEAAWLDTLDRFQADPGAFFAAGGFGRP